jgi:hypothetical protein
MPFITVKRQIGGDGHASEKLKCFISVWLCDSRAVSFFRVRT